MVGNEINGMPVISKNEISHANIPSLVTLTINDLTQEIISDLKLSHNIAIIAKANTTNPTAELRALILRLNDCKVTTPVIANLEYKEPSVEKFQIKSAADAGLLFIDGLADGLVLTNKEIRPETIQLCEKAY